ncbi:MAG: AtpZ/AtpI family protein [Ferrovibrio sp.]|uniref:AtpZ/AtpI family protein n=1 Tax=Ferrovibrio sp. TaxID=1917215 RepID=UPI00391D762F
MAEDTPTPRPDSSGPSRPPVDDSHADLARLDRKLADVQGRRGADQRPEADPRQMQQVGKAWSLAIEMVAAVAVSLFIGWWVDRWFGTAPWGLLGFILLGVAAALWSAIRTALVMQRSQEAEAGPGGAKKTEGE